MKKLVLTIIGLCVVILSNGQKITQMTEATTAPTGSLLMIRNGNSGDVLRRITIDNLKLSLFASPVFTTTVTIPSPFTLGSTSVTTNGMEFNLLDGALFSTTEANYLVGVSSAIQTQLNGKEASLGNPSSNGYILSSTISGVRSWIAPGSGGGLTSEQVATQINDSLTARIGAGIESVALADSNIYDGGYATPTFVNARIAASGGGADSSLYVTITRLTDSLSVIRSQINNLIALIEAAGINLVTSINVAGEGGATSITSDGGTLQMYANVEPNNAADTTITWSRINGTGTATISAGGLLTALTNGTVTARATANDGSGVYGEEEITISNQESNPTNMLSNGTLDSGTDWTLGSGVTISGGVLNIPRAGTYFSQLEADMITPLEVSTHYHLEFDLTAPDGAIGISLWDGGNSVTLLANANYSAGHQTLEFTTPSSLNYDKGLRIAIAYTEAGSMDNITLTEQ